MQKFIILTAMACMLSLTINAQSIKSISVQNLESRFKTGKDTIYIVNFWATWCRPCVVELPHLEKFSITYKSRPVKVLLVSVDSKTKLESSVKPFIIKHGLTNEVLSLTETAYAQKIDKNWTGALPATLFINAKTGTRNFHGGALTYQELVTKYDQAAK